MSHTLGVVCPQCNDVLVPDTCPERGCSGHHGYSYAPMSEWAAKTWPKHPCFTEPAATS